MSRDDGSGYYFTPPLRVKHIKSRNFSLWRWADDRSYRWRMFYRWSKRRCQRCREVRYLCLQKVLQRAWRQVDGHWQVRSYFQAHIPARAIQSLVPQPPRKPAKTCQCIPWLGPAVLNIRGILEEGV